MNSRISNLLRQEEPLCGVPKDDKYTTLDYVKDKERRMQRQTIGRLTELEKLNDIRQN